MKDKLDSIAARYEALGEELSDPNITRDRQRFQEVARRHAELGEIVGPYREFQRVQRELAESRQLLRDEDADLRELAAAEVAELEPRLAELEQELKVRLLPSDPHDEKNAIVEIRAGAGGEEACLFAGDLLRMYLRYA